MSMNRSYCTIWERIFNNTMVRLSWFAMVSQLRSLLKVILMLLHSLKRYVVERIAFLIKIGSQKKVHQAQSSM